jgi:hypothetical protein
MHGRSIELCGEQSGTEDRFLSKYLPLSVSLHQFSVLTVLSYTIHNIVIFIHSAIK